MAFYSTYNLHFTSALANLIKTLWGDNPEGSWCKYSGNMVRLMLDLCMVIATRHVSAFIIVTLRTEVKSLTIKELPHAHTLYRGLQVGWLREKIFLIDILYH